MYKHGHGVVEKKNNKYWFGNVQVFLPDHISLIFSKTTVTDTCWLYNGSKSKNGYALIKYKGKKRAVHRFLYETFFGPISKDLVCCHKCDVRNCINPAHIFLGTRTENQKDMKEKGRAASGSRNGTSKLSELDIPVIREMYKNGIYQKDIAKKFNVSQTIISKIILGKTWDHVKGESWQIFQD